MKTLFCLFAVFFLALPALAEGPPPCACAERRIVRRFAEAEAVFIGTVRNIAPFDEVTRGGGSGKWNKNLPQADRPVAVTLRVDHAYKGAEGSAFTLHTSLTQYTCAGHPFVKGGQYLVFAYRRNIGESDTTSLYSFPDGTWEVGGLCGGTKRIEAAAADLKWLETRARRK